MKDKDMVHMHPEVKYMPLNFAIYYNILAEILIHVQNEFDYYLSVTISDPRGLVVGNFQLSFSAPPLLGNSVLESTSETLRENLKHLKIHKPKHKMPKSDAEFGYYLAGLIEGDGHFSKQNLLVISFHIQDIRLAYYLKSKLKFGSVRKVKGKEAATYVISNKEGLLKVISLINGKIRTPVKHSQIQTNVSYPIHQLPLDTTPFTNNYWFAGFCDADASFQVKIIYRDNRKKAEIRLSLQIDQKTRYILDRIFEEFGGSIGHRVKTDTYYYSSVSYSVAHKFLSYFRVFHLLSYKYVNFIKWSKVYQYIESREHLTDKGIKKIITQKDSMRFF